MAPFDAVDELARKVWKNFISLLVRAKQDENVMRIFKAIKKGDIPFLKDIFEIPAEGRLVDKETMMTAAIHLGNCDAIKFLIDNGYDIRSVDENGNTALNLFLIVWNEVCKKATRVDICEILLASYSNDSDVFEAVFLNNNEIKMSPFLMACALGCDAYILRFLVLLENRSISIDKFIGHQGSNVFHFLIDSSSDLSTVEQLSGRVETFRALIDKIPFSTKLIDAKNDEGKVPLQELALKVDLEESNSVGELAKIFFQHGACPDTKDQNGVTYLIRASSLNNVSLVEASLRAGCHVDSRYLLYVIAKASWRSKSKSIRVVELLLAFGYDLQNDFSLREIDRCPEMDLHKLYPDILEALQEVRRSNKMISLQRQCRNTIRRHLKGKADEAIGKLTCIPDRIKSFLLVENERSVLGITE